MHSLTYKRILFEDDIDIPRLIMIYQKPAVAKYISISENYFHYVTNTENVYFYKIFENNKLIGATHLEKHGSVLFMDILVFPEFQRMGLGTKIVKDIQNDIFGLAYERIEVSIDERNAASLKLFNNTGFVCTSKEYELINFVYQRRTDL